MSWGQELWDRVDAVIGQISEDTDELTGVFTRSVFVILVVQIHQLKNLGLSKILA